MSDPGAPPRALYRAEQVRELDRIAIEEEGIPGATLMDRAGQAAFERLRERWPGARRIAVLCGAGNNGGDGFVVARLASAAGFDVAIGLMTPAAGLTGDARGAYDAMTALGVVPVAVEAALASDPHIVVDALLGTGLDRTVRGEWADVIQAANALPAPAVALDVPSGLHADTGRVLGAAIRAELTVTFIGLKQGLFTGAGRAHCGEVAFAGLEVPRRVYARAASDAVLVDLDGCAGILGRRSPVAHKGHFGHVLVVGGDHGMGGAARLAAEAAARSGAGLVSVATRESHAAALTAARPELMARGVESADDLAAMLSRATVLAVGPGLGQAPWGRAMFGATAASGLATVLDADALNLLAAGTGLGRREGARPWVLTPHPGEASRLLGCTVAEVEADRFAAVRALSERLGAVVALKGAGTLLCEAGGLVQVCTGGNPGMATGGMGDVLTGIVAALLAQGLEPAPAAIAGVCLHAAAADRAARDGERGLLASDLLAELRSLASAL